MCIMPPLTSEIIHFARNEGKVNSIAAMQLFLELGWSYYSGGRMIIGTIRTE